MICLDRISPAWAGAVIFTIVAISSPLARADDGASYTNTEIGRKITLKSPRPALPGTVFIDEKAREHTFKEFQGKGFVLNIWATWCIPCLREMPTLNRLGPILRKKGIAVLALSVDRAPFAKITRFIDKHGFTNLHVFQDVKGATARKLNVEGLPTTLIVDARGREIGRILGIAQWDKPENVKAITALLSSSPGSSAKN